MSRERVRVLWLTKGLGLGGTEQLLHLTGSYIDAARFEVEVAYVLPWKDALVGPIRQLGMRVHCLSHNGGSLGWVATLIRLIRSQHYDVIHTHSPLAAAIARSIPGCDAVFIHTEHSAWSRYRMPTLIMNAVTFWKNDAVFAVSRAVFESIASAWWLPFNAAGRTEVLYHGIDESRIVTGAAARSKARALLGVPDDVPLVGSVGSLTPKKDRETLLRAFASVRERVPQAQLVIIGGGPLEAQLRSLSGGLGLSNAVRFLGIRDDVQDLVPGFDVFALTSTHEGLGLTLIEAMSAGVPCVATNVEGIPEVVEDGVNGILTPPRAVEAIADGIVRLLTSCELHDRLGACASITSKRFSIQRAVRRIEQVYEAQLTKRTASRRGDGTRS